MGKNFRETLNEQMKDPEFRAEWEAQEPERQIMHAILEGRQNCNLILSDPEAHPRIFSVLHKLKYVSYQP